jgi:hypothetical protein
MGDGNATLRLRSDKTARTCHKTTSPANGEWNRFPNSGRQPEARSRARELGNRCTPQQYATLRIALSCAAPRADPAPDSNSSRDYREFGHRQAGDAECLAATTRACGGSRRRTLRLATLSESHTRSGPAHKSHAIVACTPSAPGQFLPMPRCASRWCGCGT